MRILLTNDDGYHSEGIIALENALSEIGDCYVVAPASETTASLTRPPNGVASAAAPAGASESGSAQRRS